MSINSASITLAKASSQYLSATNNYNFTTGTAEAWIKLTSLPSVTGYGYSLLSCANNSSAQGFDLVIGTTNKASITFGAGAQVATSTTTLVTGTWYHIAGVWTTADKKIYVNGTLEATNSNAETLTSGAATIYIGNTAAATTRYADMKVDDIRIWNTNRSQANISANMSTELTGSETNLQGYWDLDNILTDLTSGANTLTNNGSAAFSVDVPFVGSIAVSDTVTISDSVAMLVYMPVNATDTVTMSDSQKLRLNWTDNTKSSGTWTNTTKS